MCSQKEAAPIERKSSGRIQWVDIAKGIAIISILLHHISFQDAAGKELFSPIVAEYDVPLFFMTAGLFVSAGKPFKTYVVDKAKRLLGPYVVTCVAIGCAVVACRIILGATNPPTIWSGVREFAWSCVYGAGTRFDSLPDGVGYIGAIWFLEAMFVALLEVRIVLSVMPGRDTAGFIAVSALAVLGLHVAKATYIPFNVNQGLVAGWYVYVGYLYRRHLGLDRAPRYEVVLALAFIVLFSAGFDIRASMVRPAIPAGLLTIVQSLCACELVVCLAKTVENRAQVLARPLLFFGRNSMVVLCVHLFFLDIGLSGSISRLLMAWLGEAPLNVVSGLSLGIQVAVAVLTVLLLRRTKYLRKIFLP